ncbi:MAG: tetratricopeptide repeat protein [Candidatus Omnitrophica bacterium]|nr:tetratricopeptide repeat protein [Candidatus Omnitrophota bacterium]
MLARPVLSLSLALNYAAGTLNPWGYHLVNTAIHLLSAWVLYGILRRILPRSGGKGSPADASAPAAAAALLWAVHPLQTESVTYIIQRSELMAGLCVLSALYSSIRGWRLCAAASVIIGIGAKPTAAVAPLLVFLYHRFFQTGSWLEILKREKALYAGLAAGLAMLAVQMSVLPKGLDPSAGLGLKEVTPAAYAMTQPGVILHYLKLTLWPVGLCLNYEWPLAETAAQAVAPGLLLLVLAAVTVLLFRRRNWAGFWAAWFFLTLAPTSSVIPLADAAFEHRMYLPLIGPVTLLVLGLGRFLSRRWFWAVVLAAALGLSALTIRRNGVYASETAMWTDVVSKRPLSSRAHNNLGLALAAQGRHEEALEEFRKAVALNPLDAVAHNNLGLALLKQKRVGEAEAIFRELIRTSEKYTPAYNNLALLLTRRGETQEAIRLYRKSLALDPYNALTHKNLGVALQKEGRMEEAEGHFRRAAELSGR